MDPISLGALFAGVSSLFSGGAAAAGGGFLSGGMFSSLASMGSVAGGLGTAGSLGMSALKIGSGLGSLYNNYQAIGTARAAQPYVAQAAQYDIQGIQQQGEAAAQASEFNRNVDLQNAVYARFQGQQAADAQARSSAQTIASGRMSYGASGVTLDSGSAMDVLADSTRMATLDNLNLKFNAELQAKSYEMQASLEDQNATNTRKATETAVQAARARAQAQQISALTGMRGASSSMFGSLTSMIPNFG